MRINQPSTKRGIYRNALPFYIDRVDICYADSEKESWTSEFISLLFQKNLSLQLNASDYSVEKMRHLYFESRNLEKIHGAKTFGFGFPVLIDTHDNDLMVAPLFIWMLTLEPTQNKVDSWIIKFGNSNHIQPNYFVLQYLKEKYGINIEGKAQSFAFEKKIDWKELQNFCKNLTDLLHFEMLTGELTINKMPALDDIGHFSQKGVLHWSGVLGLFPPQASGRPFAFNDSTPLLNKAVEPDKTDLQMCWQGHSPILATILETVARNKVTVVDGTDQQIRRDAITSLLLNSLSNGKRTLVISSQVASLKASQALLAKTGLGQLHFLLDDSLNDKLPMLELLRVASGGSSRRVPHSENDFLFKKHHFQRTKEKVDKSFAAARRFVFQKLNWSETVGLYLHCQRIEGKELLNSQLNPTDFAFTDAEYESIRAGIVNSRPSFEKVKTLNHPLNSLNDRFFGAYGLEESFNDAKEQIEVFLSRFRELHHKYILLLDSYAVSLKQLYQEKYSEFQKKAKKVIETIDGFSDSIGPEFSKSGKTSFDFFFLFSSRKKKIRQAQDMVSLFYNELCELNERHSFFNFQFESCNEGRHISRVKNNVNAFLNLLTNWNNGLDISIQEEIARLNNKTFNPELEYKDQVTELQNALDTFLLKFNEAHLYQRTYENKTLTLPQRQKYLESIIEQLETSQLNLRDFHAFYQWQCQWLSLSNNGQKVVRALIKVKPRKWKEALDSWYLFHLLLKNFSQDLPNDEMAVQQFSDALFALKPLIHNKIIDLWQNRQIEVLRQLKRADSDTFRLLFEKSGQIMARTTTCEKIFEKGHSAISTFLPVIFLTPEIAAEVIPDQPEFYDYVIFDEANRLSVEDASKIAFKTKHQIIFGSSASAGVDNNLVHEAVQNGAAIVKVSVRFNLPQYHREPGMKDFSGFRMENVEGRYNEIDSTNDIEAQHVVRLLNQIKQSPQRIYPNVGVVTFSKPQRDLISTYLLKLKQTNSTGGEKILQLERNGMGVFALEEIHGQQFDIMIVSCTLGQTNIEGNVSKKLMLLNEEPYFSGLEALVRIQAEQIHIVHSLPESAVAKHLLNPNEKGTWLLSLYLKFVEGVINGNEYSIGQFLDAVGVKKPMEASQTYMADQIERALTEYFDDKLIVKNHVTEGLAIPVSVKLHPKSKPEMAIVPDGFFSTEDYTCGYWENEQRQKLSKAGKKYLPVWTSLWLRNPFNETRILASKILKARHELKEKTKDGLQTPSNESKVTTEMQ